MGKQLLAEMREHPGGSEYHVAMFATVPTRGLAPLRLTLKPNSRRLKPVLRTNSHPRACAATANKNRAATRGLAPLRLIKAEQLGAAALHWPVRRRLRSRG